MKLRSGATLFAHVSAVGSAFHRILSKYFTGNPDRETVRLLGKAVSTRASASDAR